MWLSPTFGKFQSPRRKLTPRRRLMYPTIALNNTRFLRKGLAGSMCTAVKCDQCSYFTETEMARPAWCRELNRLSVPNNIGPNRDEGRTRTRGAVLPNATKECAVVAVRRRQQRKVTLHAAGLLHNDDRRRLQELFQKDPLRCVPRCAVQDAAKQGARTPSGHRKRRLADTPRKEKEGRSNRGSKSGCPPPMRPTNSTAHFKTVPAAPLVRCQSPPPPQSSRPWQGP